MQKACALFNRLLQHCGPTAIKCVSRMRCTAPLRYSTSRCAPAGPVAIRLSASRRILRASQGGIRVRMQNASCRSTNISTPVAPAAIRLSPLGGVQGSAEYNLKVPLHRSMKGGGSVAIRLSLHEADLRSRRVRAGSDYWELIDSKDRGCSRHRLVPAAHHAVCMR